MRPVLLSGLAAAALTAVPSALAGPPPPPDTFPPHVTGTKLFPPKFASGDKKPTLEPAGARIGTTIRFVLSEPSQVAFLVERPTIGRVAGSTCVRTTTRNRTARHCTRWVRAGRFSMDLQTGSNRVRFEGRFASGPPLEPGKYRITLTPTDLANNRGPFQRRPFTIVERRAALTAGSLR